MAKILETISKRRTIKLSVEDVIAVIRHYQRVTRGNTNATIVRDLIESANFYLPEDV